MSILSGVAFFLLLNPQGELQQSKEAYDAAAALQKENPPIANHAEQEAAGTAVPWGRIFSGDAVKMKGLTVNPKMIAGSDGSSALGIEYKYHGFHSFWSSEDVGVPVAQVNISFDVSGTATFDDDVNSQNLATSKLAVSYLRNTGIYSTGKQWKDGEKLAEEYVAADSSGRRRILDTLKRGASPAFYFTGDASVGTESDARFSSTSLTYGGSVYADFASYDLGSLASKLNFFDYAFAATRWLTSYSDYDADITPRGSAWPSLRIALDLVDPDENNPRSKAGDSSDFTRVTVETSLKTPFAKVQGIDFLAVFSYRYYHELSASDTVEAADLDAFDYLAAGIETESGFFATYRSGQLPFDVENDNAVEVGWKFHL